MEKRKPVSFITEWVLKVSVIIYFYFLLFPPEAYDIFTGAFWSSVLNVIYFVLFLVISLLVVIPSKSTFRIVAFFLVSISAFLKMLMIIYDVGFRSELSVYFLIFAIAVYQMARMYMNRKIT